MSQQNLISINISEQDLTDINNAINVLKLKLLPILKSLKPEERHELAKMGDKSVAFVNKSHEYAITNPELVPLFLDMEEFKKDVKALEQLSSFHSSLQQLVDMLSDSILMAGSDAFKAALMFYESVKTALKSNVSKAKTIYEDLSPRFPGRKKNRIAK